MMTKKHFELIAQVLSNQKEIDIKLVNELMDIFEMINPNFNRNIFLKKVVNKNRKYTRSFKKIFYSEEDKLMQDKNIKWTNPSIIKSYESN
tara:strand:- start:226 stop:498 length:273 start_codon:yes stop_codon:yes gene_type:complete